MKKILSVLLILIIPVIMGYAITPYMTTYGGTYAIPMDSPAYGDLVPGSTWVSKDTIDGSGDWGPVSHDQLLDAIIADKNKRKYYSDFNMVSLGGYKDFTLSDPATGQNFDRLILRVIAESPAGLNFISLSNPSITRPYGLGVFSSFKYKSDSGATKPTNGESFVFKNSGDAHDFEFTVSGNSIYDLWYDMVLILPGAWDEKSKTLADSKNRINVAGSLYELVDSNDYSTVVNIKIELYGKHSTDPAETPAKLICGPNMLSIPLSGYYHYGAASRDESVSFGMHIMPNNNCANLNINQQQGKMVKIADIDLISRDVMVRKADRPVYPGPAPTVTTKPDHPGAPPVKPPVTPKGEYVMTSRPEETYGGYYGNYENNYEWPVYSDKNKNHGGSSIKSKPPINREDYKRSFFLGGGYYETEYKRDLAIWQGMQKGTISPEYQSFLDSQKAWDKYVKDTDIKSGTAVPEYKEWKEKDNIYKEWLATNVKYKEWEDKMAAWRAYAGDDMFVFFSSNQNPYYPNPEPFMLVHEGKPGDTPLNARNHIKFILVAYDSDDNTTKSFDGTTYFEPMGDPAQFEKFIKTHKKETIVNHGMNQYNHKYTGEIYLVMENKPDQVMIRGKYSERIYVHVIGSR